MPTTSEIVDQHLKCFCEKDLDGVVADYSSDAVLFIPGRPLRGVDRDQAIFPDFRCGVFKAWRHVFNAAAIR